MEHSVCHIYTVQTHQFTEKKKLSNIIYENMGKSELTFLRTSHSIEGESLAEFIADDEEYRLGVLQLLESLKMNEIDYVRFE